MPNLRPSEGIELEQDLDSFTMKTFCALGARREFSKNEHLYRQGDPAKHVFILQSGSVKSTSTHAHGFETLLKIHQPGSLLGLSALRPKGLRDANGTAVNEVVAVCFPRAAFLKILKEDGALGLLLVRVLLKRQQELHARIRNILGNSVEQRLADVLLQLHAQAVPGASSGTLNSIFITHEDLASLVISRRQYVTQILQNFVFRELIETGRKKIRIVDADGLRRVADA